MFVGYPYSHEDLKKFDEEIKKNREEHPEYRSVIEDIGSVIGALAVCGYALAGLIFLVYLIFFCP